MGTRFQTAVIGLSGVGGIEVIDQVQKVTPQTISDGVGLLGQIVILIVTLIGLFKKKKVTDSKN